MTRAANWPAPWASTPVRAAADPWAFITRAVQVTLIYDSRAEGLLCSTHQARRSTVSANHDAERFSDSESELVAFHPAFHSPAEQDERDWDEDTANSDAETANAWMTVLRAVRGNQRIDFRHTTAGRGVLLLLLMGYLPSEIAADHKLSHAIESTAPTEQGAT